ncbi:MAG: hypothetical protein HYW89_04220 [Candidatus Sungiibacteriota bacterium]|uniref:Uncharacterized protein n=1 Tax=Candidatus Sungiibacteriota bacterium TaxID=2750080 RepID=A0A7T5UQJ5_9BACT|nr:MAG: hypothetical protein HYW89_04220 [Candidatus Sungbacteria bacterium]
MEFKSKSIILVSIVVVVVIAAAGFWYWSQKKSAVPEEPAAEVKDGLGAEVFKKSNNPLSNELPETNPFNVDTNPFR